MSNITILKKTLLKEHGYYSACYYKLNNNNNNLNSEISLSGSYKYQIVIYELYLLIAAGAMKEEDKESFLSMLYSEDEQNQYIALTILKVFRKVLKKLLSDPIEENRFITKVLGNYYQLVHKPAMLEIIKLNKKQ